MRRTLLPVDPASYAPSVLHAGDADWAETNCATDMWIEILHSWGLDPVPGLAFTVGTDFDGEQWTMFTYPEEDLRLLYGVEVHELNVWRPLVEHLEDHLRLGHLVAVDVDAYYLPDTAGVTYRAVHQKTTVAVQMLDRGARSMGYFHNAGYAELAGDDFDGILRLGPHAHPLADAMPPFAATVRLDGVRLDPPDLADLVRDRLAVHLARRPVDNPVGRLGKRMTDDLSDLAAGGMDAFHRYAFGSCRHLGANGELAAAFVGWLADHDPGADRPALEQAAARYRAVSTGAKAAEFTLARAARGRAVDLHAVMAPIEDAWDQALAVLDARYGA
ncbi:MAG: DUF1839 family protein [Acidimicrobiales bacterium]